MSEGQAIFAALSRVDVEQHSALSYGITQSFPTGNSAEMTITVIPDQAADPRAATPVTASYSETDEGDFTFRLEYFIHYEEIPDDVEEEIRGAVAGMGAPIAHAGFGAPLVELAADGDSGIRVIAEGIVKKLVETRVGDFLKGLEAGLGSEALLDTLYKALKAGMKVWDALAINEEHDALMKRIDALEDCAENPTNPITRRGYETDPSQKQRILDAIAEARTEIKSNFAVMFLGLLNSVGAGLAGPASRVLGFIVGPATSYVKQQLRELNDAWIRDLEKLVTPCDAYQFRDATLVYLLGWEGTGVLDATTTERWSGFVCGDPLDAEWTITLESRSQRSPSEVYEFTETAKTRIAPSATMELGVWGGAIITADPDASTVRVDGGLPPVAPESIDVGSATVPLQRLEECPED